MQSVAYLGGGLLCHAPPWRSQIRKIGEGFKVQTFFLENTMFL